MSWLTPWPDLLTNRVIAGQRTHPILFREDMATALNSDTPVKTSHYSPMLHNAILSIGLCYCDEPQLRTPAFRKVFVTEAKKHVEIEGKNPTVATVQALAHLASGHSVDAEHNLGWLYIGMALRCALARKSAKSSVISGFGSGGVGSDYFLSCRTLLVGLNMDNTAMLKSGKISETQAREVSLCAALPMVTTSSLTARHDLYSAM